MIETTAKPKHFLTTREAASYLSVSLSHLYKLTSRHEITFYRPTGKLMYFQRKDLDAFILRNKIRSSEEIKAEADD